MYAMCEDDQKRETFASHHILFLDTERWYISCNKYLHFVFDPYYLLDTLESVLYTYNTMATTASSYAIQAVNVQAFYNQFQIFVGVFCLEAMAYARILKKSTYDIADLNNHSAFYKTQKSRDHLRHLFKPLSKEPHLAFLLQKLQKTSALMDQNITIDTKLLHHTHISFTLSHQTKFTDWSEFL
ncbi:hypothetical protein GW750_07725 [bacterium]|nr:hypothetical protein [bacterium]